MLPAYRALYMRPWGTGFTLSFRPFSTGQRPTSCTDYVAADYWFTYTNWIALRILSPSREPRGALFVTRQAVNFVAQSSGTPLP